MKILKSELDILAYWMAARDTLRDNRKMGRPPPWTSDPLLRDYRWCNVRRMDDKVSKALMSKWYMPAQMSGEREMLVAAGLARLFNWMPTLMALSQGKRFTVAALARGQERVEEYARGDFGYAKVFTAAYIVPGNAAFASKVDMVFAIALRIHASAAEIWAGTAKQTWANLVEFVPGLGPFLAGQMVADIAFLCDYYSWPDSRTWAPAGPGSARGLNRLLGLDKDRAVAQDEFEQWLPVVTRELGNYIDVRNWGLVAMDIQNCLCEYDKYRRLTLGEGTVRSRYDGKPSMWS